MFGCNFSSMQVATDDMLNLPTPNNAALCSSFLAHILSKAQVGFSIPGLFQFL